MHLYIFYDEYCYYLLQVVKESFKLLNSVQKNEGTPEKGHGDESRLYTNYIIYNKLYTHGHVYFCFVSAEQCGRGH